MERPARARHLYARRAGVPSLLLAAALEAIACAEPPAPAPAAELQPAITDSAGVRRVVSHGPRWQPGEEWTISEEPTLRIGMEDGPAPYLFDRVRGATRLSDGTIVVLNSGDAQVRFYDGDGQHLRSVGRPGQGPGEMRAPRWLQRLEDDAVQVTHTDGALRWGPDGTLLSQDRLRWERIHEISAAGGPANSAGFLMESCGVPAPLFLGDVVVLCASTYTDVRFLPTEAGLHHSVFLVARSDPTLQTLDTVAVFPNADLIMYPAEGRLYSARLIPPYGPRGTMRVGGSPPHLIYADARTYRIERHALDGSGRRLVMERAGGHRAPTEGELASFGRSIRQDFDFRISLYPPGNPASFRTLVTPSDSLSVLAGGLPPYVDDLGAVWGWIADPPGAPHRTFEVFDEGGIYLGQVRGPVRLRIHEIGVDYVLGVSTDDLGIEYVVMHRLDGRAPATRAPS